MFKKLLIALMSLLISGFVFGEETRTEKENYGDKKSSEVNKGQQGELKREQNRERKEAKEQKKEQKKAMKKEQKKEMKKEMKKEQKKGAGKQ